MTTSATQIAIRLQDVISAAAPKDAHWGKWRQTIELAGVSSGRGGFSDKMGEFLKSVDDDDVSEAIQMTVQSVYETGDQSWNEATVLWHIDKAELTVETNFNADIVPRDIDDPVYEQSAGIRRAFWKEIGTCEEGYLGPEAKTNGYGQTGWLSPHRRLIRIDTATASILATDGLSTPWPGISDKTNGIGIEVFFEVPGDTSSDQWTELLLSVGDMISDEGGVEGEIVAISAILFCSLPDEVAPYSHVVLNIPASDKLREISSLPFGSVRLIEATAVTLDDLSGHDLEVWTPEAALQALERRRFARTR